MENGSVAAFYEDYSLYRYGITIGAALLLGVLVSMIMRRLQRERVNDVLFAAIPAIPLGIIGARAFYCWHGDRQLDLHLLSRLETYLDGGFALYGALGMGMAVMLLVCTILRINILRLSDACAPGLAFGICVGRLASYFSNTDRGPAVSAEALRKFPFSTWDPSEEEWILNVYFFEAAAAFLIFVLLSFMLTAGYRTSKFSFRKGDVALSFMFLYGLSQCFFESLRTDALFWHSTAVPRLHFVMISQAVSAVIAALALSVLILRSVYMRGISAFSVACVILSALGFSMIFSQEIRLPFKDASVIVLMCANGAAALIVMGLCLIFMQVKDFRSEPALPWLGLRYWLEKLRGANSFAPEEKERAS